MQGNSEAPEISGDGRENHADGSVSIAKAVIEDRENEENEEDGITPAPADGVGDRFSPANRWPQEETLALLSIRSEMDVVFRQSGSKAPLWDQVSRYHSGSSFRFSVVCWEERDSLLVNFCGYFELCVNYMSFGLECQLSCETLSSISEESIDYDWLIQTFWALGLLMNSVFSIFNFGFSILVDTPFSGLFG